MSGNDTTILRLIPAPTGRPKGDPLIHVTGAWVSTVGAAVAVEVTRMATDQRENDLREKLAHTGRHAALLFQDHGILLPVLLGVQVQPQLPSEGSPAKDELTETIRSWEADQDWHRGEFILLVLREGFDGEPPKWVKDRLAPGALQSLLDWSPPRQITPASVQEKVAPLWRGAPGDLEPFAQLVARGPRADGSDEGRAKALREYREEVNATLNGWEG
jgi:hypothetical protein